MKDGNGSDHLPVAWLKPGDSTPTVINGTYLSPYLPVQSLAIAWSFDEIGWNGAMGEMKAAANSLIVLIGIGAADAGGASAFTGAVEEVALHHAPLSPESLITLRDLRHAFDGNQSPLVTNLGTQNSLLYATVSLPITASDPEANPISSSFGKAILQLLHRLLVLPTHRPTTPLDPQRHYQPSFPKSDSLLLPGRASFIQVRPTPASRAFW